MKHVESFAVKLPIDFSCMIYWIILKQHLNIMNQGDVKSKKDVPLTFDMKLFIGTHVLHYGALVSKSSCWWEVLSNLQTH